MPVRKDNRLFRVLTVILLAGVLCLLILVYNHNVIKQIPTPNSQIQQQTEPEQLPKDDILPTMQSI